MSPIRPFILWLAVIGFALGRPVVGLLWWRLSLLLLLNLGVVSLLHLLLLGVVFFLQLLELLLLFLLNLLLLLHVGLRLDSLLLLDLLLLDSLALQILLLTQIVELLLMLLFELGVVWLDCRWRTRRRRPIVVGALIVVCGNTSRNRS